MVDAVTIVPTESSDALSPSSERQNRSLPDKVVSVILVILLIATGLAVGAVIGFFLGLAVFPFPFEC